jgi:hypothetical protein
VRPGPAWQPAGDLNGDGYADAALGLSLSVTTGIDTELTATALVYYGSASGLPAAPSARIDAPTQTSRYAVSFAASGGDLDGDGFDDLVVRDTTTRICAGGPSGIDVSRCATLDASAWTGGIASGDLDGDGRTDLSLTVAVPPGAGIAVLLGGPSGVAFPATTTLVAPYADTRYGPATLYPVE